MAHENNKDNPAAISKTKIFRWSVFLLIFSVIVVIGNHIAGYDAGYPIYEPLIGMLILCAMTLAGMINWNANIMCNDIGGNDSGAYDTSQYFLHYLYKHNRIGFITAWHADFRVYCLLCFTNRPYCNLYCFPGLCWYCSW